MCKLFRFDVGLVNLCMYGAGLGLREAPGQNPLLFDFELYLLFALNSTFFDNEIRCFRMSPAGGSVSSLV